MRNYLFVVDVFVSVLTSVVMDHGRGLLLDGWSILMFFLTRYLWMSDKTKWNKFTCYHVMLGLRQRPVSESLSPPHCETRDWDKGFSKAEPFANLQWRCSATAGKQKRQDQDQHGQHGWKGSAQRFWVGFLEVTCLPWLVKRDGLPSRSSSGWAS